MAMKFELPALGEGVESAEVAEVLVAEGDSIDADQVVMELETDKAVADLPCPHAGRVAEVHVSEGATVHVGDLLLTIESPEGDGQPSHEEAEADKDQPEAAEASREQDQDESEERKESSKSSARKTAAESGKKEARPDPAAGNMQPEQDETPEDTADQPAPAGPATRRLARKLDVDLEQADGTGPGGRITQEDIVHQRDAERGAGAEEPELHDFSPYGEVQRERVTGVRKLTAERVARSARLIPQVTQHALADITDAEHDRRTHNEHRGDDEPKVSLTAVAVKAAAIALQENPRFNASFDGLRQELVLKKSFHIGIAVATDRGLLVPVVRDADSKSLIEIAGEVLDLAHRAREGQLDAEQMRGATFTITNQGPVETRRTLPQHLGDVSFTPIVPWPQVAILGLSRARRQVEVVDEEAEVRLMLPLSLSYDHRVIDGTDVVRFVMRVSELLSQTFELAAGA